MVMRSEGEFKFDIMTEAFLNKYKDSFWGEARKNMP